MVNSGYMYMVRVRFRVRIWVRVSRVYSQLVYDVYCCLHGYPCVQHCCILNLHDPRSALVHILFALTVCWEVTLRIGN